MPPTMSIQKLQTKNFHLLRGFLIDQSQSVALRFKYNIKFVTGLEKYWVSSLELTGRCLVVVVFFWHCQFGCFFNKNSGKTLSNQASLWLHRLGEAPHLHYWRVARNLTRKSDTVKVTKWQIRLTYICL